MLKRVLLLSVSSRTMSKKFKSESVKKTLPKHIEISSNSVKKESTYQNEIEKGLISNETQNTVYKFPEVPIKSVNDKKEYSVIKLNNGLVALLVSDEHSNIEIVSDLDNEDDNEVEGRACSDEDESNDEESEHGDDLVKKEEKLAACSLTVGVGSFSDPNEVPGMAHFVEHMIFMGSKKYPEENYFDSFIKKLGGSDNASTECESTNFYFECPDENLSKAMDVFSNLFTAPLMTESAMLREREAVESEFIQNMPDDHYRRQQILMTSAAPGNPAGKFVWGNIKTLRDNVTDTFLYEATHSFWKTYYSANKMTLAVQARLPLETLEKMVVKHFSKVPNSSIDPQKHELPEIPFNASKFNQIYYIESVKDYINLGLSWVLPPVKHLYRTKPTNYLSFVIGHEGKGSLISYLRKNHWAIALSAGHDDDDLANNDLYSIFSISIVLTELGANNLQSIFRAVFSYIKMLQMAAPEERIFKEVQQIADMNFRFEEESSSAEYVETLTGYMQLYPIPHYINGNDLLFEYSPELITKYLNCLTPSAVNIMLSRKKHDEDIQLDLVEPWFSTNYTSKRIPDSWMSEWMNIKPYPEFHIPQPNKFIASDFTLFNKSKEGAKYPEQIFSCDNLAIWYKPDTKFDLPTGFIGFHFINKSTFESILENTALKLYTELLHHLLIEELYPSVMALLEYKIVEADGSLLVEVYGFNQNLHILLEKIAEYIQKFDSQITDTLVQMYKETRLKAYYNNNFKISNLAKEIRLNITLEKFFTSAEKCNVVDQINIELIKKISRDFFQNSQVQCLVQGNILKQDALSVCKSFVSRVQSKGRNNVERPLYRVYRLPNGEHCCKIKSFDKTDANCVTVNYYQLGTGNINDYCATDLLMLLMEEPLFDQLRTQEQLGYDVSCSIKNIYGIIGFSVSIVSQIDKQSVEHVEQRITNFLNNFIETLKTMPLSDFNRVAKSLIALKQCSDLHLKEEVGRNWEEIKCFEYAFDRLEQEQNVLSKITPVDVISLFEKYIHPKNPHFRKLTVQVEGHHINTNDSISNSLDVDMEDEISKIHSKSLLSELKYKYLNDTTNKETIVIDDINKFKTQLSFYPENKIFHK